MVNPVTPIWAHAESNPDNIALRSARGDLSYGELRTKSARFAAALVQHGVQPQDRIIFISPSVTEFAVVYLGMHASGATVVTMNTMATAREIQYVVEDAEPVMLIAWHEDAASAYEVAEATGTPMWVIDDGAASPTSPIEAPHSHSRDDTALILYTSGTTGRPKGAEISAQNLVDVQNAVVQVMDLGPEDRFGTALPLFHVYGQIIIMASTLTAGGSLSILYPFDPRQMLEMIRTDELTAIAGVPTMWHAMLANTEGYEREDFSSLRIASSGGASLPAQVLKAFHAQFGCDVLEGYGLTESAGACTFNGITRTWKAGTVGSALPGYEIQIRDADGTPAPPDEVGEIFLSGVGIMKGYWRQPEATAEAIRGGWLRTGDLGSLDADGYLTVRDRLKDLIIRGGYNVYPREVEDVLGQHPDIAEVAVVGVEDPKMGEEIVAVIVRSTGSEITGDTIRAWAKTYLSAYKVPRIYNFVDALPRGTTGKLLKRAIDRSELALIVEGARAK